MTATVTANTVHTTRPVATLVSRTAPRTSAPAARPSFLVALLRALACAAA